MKYDWTVLRNKYLIVHGLMSVMAGSSVLSGCNPSITQKETINTNSWQTPDTASIPRNEEGDRIRYGRDLIVRTSHYLGPQGTVMNISNGMNCQNCHLEAGTKPFGNNYLSVASTYPKLRPRSGRMETIEKRVNDCLERSLNGLPLDSLSREMRAIIAYIRWLGKDVLRGTTVQGSGLADMPYLDRAADPAIGKRLYDQKCRVCHGSSGEGLRMRPEGPFVNPPLWGENSFNTAAGLFRISNLAKYIRLNMPFGSTFENPALTHEEAWDIAAYVVSLPRPDKKFAEDWPDIKTKPVDHPFGPYADQFSEQQHKYGPFPPMLRRER